MKRLRSLQAINKVNKEQLQPERRLEIKGCQDKQGLKRKSFSSFLMSQLLFKKQEQLKIQETLIILR